MNVIYSATKIPAEYKCGTCGVHGVKLWREYNTFTPINLLECADCAEAEQLKGHKADWKSPFSKGEGDQIGWRVPAVPTEEGDTFWGYTSVPEAGCEWWKNLPTRTGTSI